MNKQQWLKIAKGRTNLRSTGCALEAMCHFVLLQNHLTASKKILKEKMYPKNIQEIGSSNKKLFIFLTRYLL